MSPAPAIPLSVRSENKEKREKTLYFARFTEQNYKLGLHGGVMVSNAASQSVWSLHVLPVYAWVLSRYSDFLPPSKNMHVWLIGDSKLSLAVNVSVCGCVSRLSCDGLATCPSCPMEAGIGSTPPVALN